MSPKIYFIEKNGKFFNSRDNVWYTSITNANYERNKPLLEQLIKLPKFVECNIYECTEEYFMENLASQTTDLVIAGEYFLRLLEDVACKMPTITQVNKTLYQKCKFAIESLKPFDKIHKEFLKLKEDTTYDVSGHYAEYIQSIGKIKIYEMGEVNSILNAYKKDRASVVGICKKILR